MESFLTRFAGDVKGTLSGLDRIRLRGTIRWLASERGMGTFLNSHRILLKDYKGWAMARTERIHQTTERLAERLGRPLLYLPGSGDRKETLTAEIARKDRVTEGLIAVLKCVEPCHTIKVGPNARTKHLELRHETAKCSHYYFYLRDPLYGPVSVRLQTWAPFSMHICLNGREWLANVLRREKIGFEQRDNCFVNIADIGRAQTLFDQQLRTDWDVLLNRVVEQWHPAHRTLFPQPLDYYWSAEETEWATDVMFRSPEALSRVYPQLLRHAVTTFGSDDVLRFLGRGPRVRQYGTSEVVTTLKTRPEGTRVKHAVNRNSIKMYDKQQQVLRVETTVNDPRDMKSYRAKEGEPNGKKSWQRLRKGVSDLHRRTQISQQSNERYLESLAAVETSTPLKTAVGKLCERTSWKGRSVRALQPLGETDGALLAAVNRGEFAINGFRNRDLVAILEQDTATDPAEAKRRSARITRLLRLLRAHGLIKKIPQTHRYQLTPQGRTNITAILVAQQTSIQQLAKLAA